MRSVDLQTSDKISEKYRAKRQAIILKYDPERSFRLVVIGGMSLLSCASTLLALRYFENANQIPLMAIGLTCLGLVVAIEKFASHLQAQEIAVLNAQQTEEYKNQPNPYAQD